MKRIQLFLILFLLFFNFTIYADTNSLYVNISDQDKMAYALNRKVCEKFKKQYGLMPLSNTLGGPHGKIEIIGLGMFTRRLLNKDEARILLVNCIELYLREISNDHELQNHLDNAFSMNNIELDIIVNNKKRDEEKIFNIGGVGIRSGVIYYTVFNPNNFPPILSEDTEPYEEALKIVQEERKALLEASHDFFQCILKNKIN